MTAAMDKKEEIRNALKKIQGKLDDPVLKDQFKQYTRTIQFTLPDLSHSLLITVTQGHIDSITEDTHANPDIHVTTDSTTLLNILNKKTNPMTAYVTGKLKAKGKVTELLKLQKIL